MSEELISVEELFMIKIVIDEFLDNSEESRAIQILPQKEFFNNLISTYKKEDLKIVKPIASIFSRISINPNNNEFYELVWKSLVQLFSFTETGFNARIILDALWNQVQHDEKELWFKMMETKMMESNSELKLILFCFILEKFIDNCSKSGTLMTDESEFWEEEKWKETFENALESQHFEIALQLARLALFVSNNKIVNDDTENHSYVQSIRSKVLLKIIDWIQQSNQFNNNWNNPEFVDCLLLISFDILFVNGVEDEESLEMKLLQSILKKFARTRFRSIITQGIIRLLMFDIFEQEIQEDLLSILVSAPEIMETTTTTSKASNKVTSTTTTNNSNNNSKHQISNKINVKEQLEWFFKQYTSSHTTEIANTIVRIVYDDADQKNQQQQQPQQPQQPQPQQVSIFAKVNLLFKFVPEELKENMIYAIKRSIKQNLEQQEMQYDQSIIDELFSFE